MNVRPFIEVITLLIYGSVSRVATPRPRVIIITYLGDEINLLILILYWGYILVTKYRQDIPVSHENQGVSPLLPRFVTTVTPDHEKVDSSGGRRFGGWSFGMKTANPKTQ